MSGRDDNPYTQSRQRRKPEETVEPDVEERQDMAPRLDPKAISSSLESIHIPPRTPRSGRSMANGELREEVELSLLSEQERRDASLDEEDGEDYIRTPKSKPQLSGKDKRAMALLIVLCESVTAVLR